MSNQILSIIKNNVLTYDQKLRQLAGAAEGTLDVLGITPEIQEFRDNGIICDLKGTHLIEQDILHQIMKNL